MFLPSGIRLYCNPKVLGIFCLGVCSGLPLALVLSTLSIWLSEAGVSKTTIGLFAIITTPYALKFLWAPLVDQMPIPFLSTVLGRRRGWLCVAQCLLMFSIIALGFTNPKEAAYMTAFWALMVAISSATQDIVIDAYRVEILSKNQQGAGAAMVVFGYRVGMLISSAGALIIAEYTSWQLSYLIMAMLLPVAMIVVMFLGEPELRSSKRSAKGGRERIQEWIKTAIVYPFLSFMRRKGWISLVIFIILYKFGDAFAGIMTNPFLVELGFSKTEIAAVVKTFGFAATIVGAILGGVLVDKLGIVRSLWICGILQMFSNLIFLVQYWVGKDLVMLSVTIACENLAGGMGTAAFVAFISALCNRHYTATQYALLSSLASVGRTWLSSSSGWTVDMVGWEWFFILSTAIALPGLILLYWIRGSYLKESYLDAGSKS